MGLSMSSHSRHYFYCPFCSHREQAEQYERLVKHVQQLHGVKMWPSSQKSLTAAQRFRLGEDSATKLIPDPVQPHVVSKKPVPGMPLEADVNRDALVDRIPHTRSGDALKKTKKKKKRPGAAAAVEEEAAVDANDTSNPSSAAGPSPAEVDTAQEVRILHSQMCKSSFPLETPDDPFGGFLKLKYFCRNQHNYRVWGLAWKSLHPQQRRTWLTSFEWKYSTASTLEDFITPWTNAAGDVSEDGPFNDPAGDAAIVEVDTQREEAFAARAALMAEEENDAEEEDAESTASEESVVEIKVEEDFDDATPNGAVGNSSKVRKATVSSSTKRKRGEESTKKERSPSPAESHYNAFSLFAVKSVLECRVNPDTNVVEALVEWEGYPRTAASWEPVVGNVGERCRKMVDECLKRTFNIPDDSEEEDEAPKKQKRKESKKRKQQQQRLTLLHTIPSRAPKASPTSADEPTFADPLAETEVLAGDTVPVGTTILPEDPRPATSTYSAYLQSVVRNGGPRVKAITKARPNFFSLMCAVRNTAPLASTTTSASDRNDFGGEPGIQVHTIVPAAWERHANSLTAQLEKATEPKKRARGRPKKSAAEDAAEDGGVGWVSQMWNTDGVEPKVGRTVRYGAALHSAQQRNNNAFWLMNDVDEDGTAYVGGEDIGVGLTSHETLGLALQTREEQRRVEAEATANGDVANSAAATLSGGGTDLQRSELLLPSLTWAGPDVTSAMMDVSLVVPHYRSHTPQSDGTTGTQRKGFDLEADVAAMRDANKEFAMDDDPEDLMVRFLFDRSSMSDKNAPLPAGSSPAAGGGASSPSSDNVLLLSMPLAQFRLIYPQSLIAYLLRNASVMDGFVAEAEPLL